MNPLAIFKGVFPSVAHLVKWGAITTAFFVLLWFFIVDVQQKLDAAIEGHAHLANQITVQTQAIDEVSREISTFTTTTVQQNRAMIRLLELECLKSAESFTDRRDCQAAREGN